MMKSPTEFLFLCLAAPCLFAFVAAYPNGAPCAAQYTMTPSPTSHGKGQEWDENLNPPPFLFEFSDEKGVIARNYEENKVYTIKLVGKKSFKGFLIQARYVNGDGTITENNPVGYFIKQNSWFSDGVRHQVCSVGLTSVTHQDASDKNEISVQWKAPASTHALQFLVTVAENRTLFWVKWTPKNGFVTPFDFTGPQQLPFPSSKLWDEDNVVDTFGPESQRLPPVQTKIIDGYGKETVIDDQTRINQATGFSQVGTFGFAGSVGRFPFSNVPLLVPTERSEPSVTEENTCASSPCRNGGICKPGEGSGRLGHVCQCLLGWAGDSCEMSDKCMSNPCVHGVCSSEPDGYKCTCQTEWGGSRCHLSCPTTFCPNGGTCRVTDLSEYTCDCRPGFTGTNCLTQPNDCDSDPCMNGGKCHDEINGYSCECSEGFVGFKCQRPCVDIYGQCDGWANEHQKCILRSLTKFFDENCPVSCKVCSPNNLIEIEGPPTIPDLDALEWLVGDWKTEASDYLHFPLSFRRSEIENVTDGYKEKMTFAVSVVPAFGAPYLNYTSIARSDSNYYDIHQSSGFLIVEPRTKPNLKCVLKSISNTGIMIVEDASIPKDGKKELVFKSSEIIHFPSLQARVPVTTSRTFRMDPNGYFLEVDTYMYFADGRTDRIVRYFTKVKEYGFYTVRKSLI